MPTGGEKPTLVQHVNSEACSGQESETTYLQKSQKVRTVLCGDFLVRAAGCGL